MNKKEVIVPANDLVCLGKDKLQELIRCKDCKHWNGDDDETFCSELGIFGTGPNSFCSYARKKEEPTMEEFMQEQDLGDPEEGRL